MEKRDLALSLLVLIVTVSGCVDGNTSNTEKDDKGSITVHRLDVSPREIYQGSSVRVSLKLVNTGEQSAVLNVTKPSSKSIRGERVLKDYCPDIFSLTASNFNTQPQELETQGSTTLYPDQEAELQWELTQDGSVPLYGYSCDLKFEIPFSYKVSSYRQVQVKADREVEGSTLKSESSSGPLLLAIETIGGTGSEGRSTFIAGEDESMRILLQLQNTENPDYNKGVVDIKEDTLKIEADGPISFTQTFSSQCPDSGMYAHKCLTITGGGSGGDDGPCDIDKKNPIRMFEGQSRVITCDVPIPDESELKGPSMVSEISASVEYDYLKDGGTRSVEVKYDGN